MLNAPEVPQQPNESETEQLTNQLAGVRGDTLELGARLARLEQRADKLPAEKTERLIRHIDERFTEVRETLARIEERIPTVAQLQARLDHLEREQQRLEGKLDDLWQDHTRLANRVE